MYTLVFRIGPGIRGIDSRKELDMRSKSSPFRDRPGALHAPAEEPEAPETIHRPRGDPQEALPRSKIVSAFSLKVWDLGFITDILLRPFKAGGGALLESEHFDDGAEDGIAFLPKMSLCSVFMIVSKLLKRPRMTENRLTLGVDGAIRDSSDQRGAIVRVHQRKRNGAHGRRRTLSRRRPGAVRTGIAGSAYFHLFISKQSEIRHWANAATHIHTIKNTNRFILSR
ncbi:hypothetical protein L596_018249 [Steinernema carpocapsae]|uniref:Uncharacterized protein n=1 Tax=Steinernema carpocapsae TaxID=34508 RepID=A0A4U5N444_STECR|nr:hypothetical protein L596_018249 [Steinernema carpocapsae]